jgi:hypothetical protein
MATNLGTYFNSLSDIIAARAGLASDSVENTDIGRNREVICKELFQKHLSPRLTVSLGGDIFGVGNQRSGQLDIIVSHDMSMAFKENDKPRVPVESVTAVISVKSTLTKAELFNALGNLASVPQLTESVVTLGLLSKPLSEYFLSWPALFLFAFDGVSLDNCIKHITDFYSSNSVPLNRIPRAIVVNRKYLVTFCQYTIPNATVNTPFDASFLRAGATAEANRGYPLFWVMIELSKGLSWLSGMHLDYELYYNEAFR